MSEAIDYAGLFPPAKLPLDQSIANYAEYRRSPDAWMLGRFIIPAAQLDALAAHAHLFQQNPPFRFSVLGSAADSRLAIQSALDADIQKIRDFRAHYGGNVAVDAFEIRLPADLVRDECTADLVRTVQMLRAAFTAADLPQIAIACEAPLGGDRIERNRILAGGLSFANTKAQLEHPDRYPPVALKLRCGGIEAAAFPSIDEVAAVLRTAVELRLPLKFTAGLHHPIRRFDASVNTHMHGFLNVLGAAILAFVVDEPAHISEREPAFHEILADESPESFRFDTERFHWRNFSATTDQIRIARRELGLAFGSCSFDEPREDLRTLRRL
jgi:hypothetical protein